jgi:DHA1 family bicyclomycin/chloramphenicol resistance-like MFS transporter
VFFGFLSGAPYVMTNLMSRPPSEYGLYFLLVSGMFMAGNLASGRMSERIGIDRMISCGVSISLLGAAALAALAALDALAPPSLFGTAAITVLGYGLSLPNSLAGAVSVDPGRAGAAAGFSGFMQMGVGGAASYVVGALMDDTARPLIAVMALASLLAFAAHALGVGRPVPREG